MINIQPAFERFIYEFANPCEYLLVFDAHKENEFFFVNHMSEIRSYVCQFPD